MKISKILDNLGKHMGRIKSLALLILGVVFTISIILGGHSKQRAENLFEKVTGLNLRNDLLLQEVKINYEEITALEIQKEALQEAYKKKEQEVEKIRTRLTRLQRKYNELSDSILTIPAEDSYTFLNTKAYPFSGEKKFPFNAPQVKGMHLTWLRKNNLETQNITLRSQIVETENLLENSNKQNVLLASKYTLSEKNQQSYLEMYSNASQGQEILKKDVKRLSKQNKFLRVWGYAGPVIGIVVGAVITK